MTDIVARRSQRTDARFTRRLESGKHILCITLNGETRPVREWEKLTGVKRGTLARRVAIGVSDDLCLRPKADFVAKDHPLWSTWRGMIERCENPMHAAFRHYGDRGISVCDRWREDFFAFAVDMGTKPTPGHTVDRIDVNGNYDPSNCRWATWKEQAANKRLKQGSLFSWNGELLTVRQIAAKLGLTKQAVLYRLGRSKSNYKRVTARAYVCRSCGGSGHQSKTCPNQGSK